MATSSSSQQHQQQNRQHHVSLNQPSSNQLPLLPPPSASVMSALSSQPSSSSRRLPPPCWSNDETVALIDTYCDKWYSLRRSNLKASHWQEVADGVGAKCRLASSPAKTAIQCRHKMEKLRKRYRTEIQRAQSMPLKKFTSTWVHFNRMDCMEKGPQVVLVANRIADSQSDGYKEDDDLDENAYNPVMYNGSANHGRNVYGSTSNGTGIDNGSRLRIKLTNGVSIAKPGNGFVLKNYAEFGQDCSTPNFNPNLYTKLGTRVLSICNMWASSISGTRDCPPSSGNGGLESRKRRRSEGNGIDVMVSAFKVMGNAFVKMEQNKMEMASELETMRMEMELKRTEMILESQERIVEAFANLVSDTNVKMKKKGKTMP